jgi:hypothetical protein
MSWTVDTDMTLGLPYSQTAKLRVFVNGACPFVMINGVFANIASVQDMYTYPEVVVPPDSSSSDSSESSTSYSSESSTYSSESSVSSMSSSSSMSSLSTPSSISSMSTEHVISSSSISMTVYVSSSSIISESSESSGPDIWRTNEIELIFRTSLDASDALEDILENIAALEEIYAPLNVPVYGQILVGAP